MSLLFVLVCLFGISVCLSLFLSFLVFPSFVVSLCISVGLFFFMSSFIYCVFSLMSVFVIYLFLLFLFMLCAAHVYQTDYTPRNSIKFSLKSSSQHYPTKLGSNDHMMEGSGALLASSVDVAIQ
jgi:hypothetical protein